MLVCSFCLISLSYRFLRFIRLTVVTILSYHHLYTFFLPILPPHPLLIPPPH
ncbi:hypothetical protein BDW69DRAFT_163141 [Aspergillus filifer]